MNKYLTKNRLSAILTLSSIANQIFTLPTIILFVSYINYVNIKNK